jgi:GNAT superfamily N-acetyltransferase
MVLGVGRRERLVECADVGAVESVDQLLNVWAIDFDQLARHRGVGAELVDTLLELFRALGLLAEQCARGARALL